MANTPIEVIAPSGLLLTAFLYPEGNDNVANPGGDTLVEGTNRKGLYTTTVSEELVGWHTLHLVDAGGATIGVYRVFMVDDEALKFADDRTYGHTMGGGAAGPGSRELDWTIQASGSPVVGAKVWITTDAAGASVVAGTFITDDSGTVIVPGSSPPSKPGLDEDVVYYGWRDSSLVQFAENPVQFRYSSANNRWEIWNGAAWEEWI